MARSNASAINASSTGLGLQVIWPVVRMIVEISSAISGFSVIYGESDSGAPILLRSSRIRAMPRRAFSSSVRSSPAAPSALAIFYIFRRHKDRFSSIDTGRKTEQASP